MGCSGSKPHGPPDVGFQKQPPPGQHPHGITPERLDDEAHQHPEGPLSKKEMKERITGSKETEFFDLAGSSYRLRYAALSQRGYYPEDLYKANQDAFKVVPNFVNSGDMLFGVFDGHGKDGDMCSGAVRDGIQGVLADSMQKSGGSMAKAYKRTFNRLNKYLRDQQEFDAYMSGTTAIVTLFSKGELHVANAGDSRAIIGERRGAHIVAIPLSDDQTPYRKDERERVKAPPYGAIIRSLDQIEGYDAYTVAWEDALGEVNEGEDADPPRIFAPNSYGPGCAFTRSIGDMAGEVVGVVSDPECVTKRLREQDQFVILASDGVWEFITNERVVEMVMRFQNPLEACRAVLAESYRLWLQFDVRTDDITMILAFLDKGSAEEGRAPRPAPAEEVEHYDVLLKHGVSLTTLEQDEGVSVGMDVVSHGAAESKPVRHNLSKEARERAEINHTDLSDAAKEEELVLIAGWTPNHIPKTDTEIARINAAVKANAFFDHLNDEQRRQVYMCMEKKLVSAGDVVIKQGEQGDWFYVVDEGTFSVTIGTESPADAPEVFRYEPHPEGGANPCFGELALLYSKPRAANVVATSAGCLWALDRLSFRAILVRSTEQVLLRTLRAVPVFRSLTNAQIRRLEDVVVEVSFKPGARVFRQGDTDDASLYIISDGKALVHRVHKEGNAPVLLAELGPGDYFGERSLLYNEPREISVSVAADETTSSGGAVDAARPLRCLQISKNDFEELLAPLQDILSADSEWRMHAFVSRQLRKEKAGFSHAKVSDFVKQGITASRTPVSFVPVRRADTGQEAYTLKMVNKREAAERHISLQRYREELTLTHELFGVSNCVPLDLAHFEDAANIYTVFPTRVATSLRSLLDSSKMGHFDAPTARFFAASVALVLEHLHNEMPAFGGVALRDVSPDAFVVDDKGNLQLLDLCRACTAEPPRLHEFVGFAHYQAPEQLSGLGHGLAGDYWGLGCLVYEMAVGGSPWLTGNESDDGELEVYMRIRGHSGGNVPFPKGAKLPQELTSFINNLLMPKPNFRLGVGAMGDAKLRSHAWFGARLEGTDEGGMSWEALAQGTEAAPKRAAAEAHLKSAIAKGFSEAELMEEMHHAAHVDDELQRHGNRMVHDESGHARSAFRPSKDHHKHSWRDNLNSMLEKVKGHTPAPSLRVSSSEPVTLAGGASGGAPPAAAPADGGSGRRSSKAGKVGEAALARLSASGNGDTLRPSLAAAIGAPASKQEQLLRASVHAHDRSEHVHALLTSGQHGSFAMRFNVEQTTGVLDHDGGEGEHLLESAAKDQILPEPPTSPAAVEVEVEAAKEPEATPNTAGAQDNLLGGIIEGVKDLTARMTGVEKAAAPGGANPPAILEWDGEANGGGGDASGGGGGGGDTAAASAALPVAEPPAAAPSAALEVEL